MSAFAQRSEVEVITLKYRTAEQVMPLLRPMLDRDGSMRETSADNRRIMVKVEEIR